MVKIGDFFTIDAFQAHLMRSKKSDAWPSLVKTVTDQETILGERIMSKLMRKLMWSMRWDANFRWVGSQWGVRWSAWRSWGAWRCAHWRGSARRWRESKVSKVHAAQVQLHLAGGVNWNVNKRGSRWRMRVMQIFSAKKTKTDQVGSKKMAGRSLLKKSRTRISATPTNAQ